MLGLKHLSISVAGIRTPPVTSVRVDILLWAIQRSTVLMETLISSANFRLDRYRIHTQIEWLV